MDRYWADRLAAGTVAAALLIGLAWAWSAAQQSTIDGTAMGSMMDGTMGHGTDPLSALLGGLLLAAVLGVGYLLLREQVTEPGQHGSGTIESGPRSRSQGAEVPTGSDAEAPTGPDVGESTGSDVEELTGSDAASPTSDAPEPPAGETLLRYLPEDERRILEPVVESPGVTQIEIRDRSGFSKSKVSQTLSDLEERGLVTREKQGRTYRVSPGAELDAGTETDR